MRVATRPFAARHPLGRSGLTPRSQARRLPGRPSRCAGSSAAKCFGRKALAARQAVRATGATRAAAVCPEFVAISRCTVPWPSRAVKGTGFARILTRSRRERRAAACGAPLTARAVPGRTSTWATNSGHTAAAGRTRPACPNTTYRHRALNLGRRSALISRGEIH